MFSTFFRFEIRLWLRGMMLYVFLGIISLLIFGASSVDEVVVGGALGNPLRNSPFVVQTFYAAASVLSCLMVTAFVNAAASRDFACDTHQLIFTKPMHKTGYLMGRFWGAVVIAMIPMLGASVGSIVAGWMPWIDADKWGPTPWAAHFWGIVLFVIPNAIFLGCIVFSIAVWTRNTMASFIGVLGLLVGVAIANVTVGQLENETLSALINPFGGSAFDAQTKYWTVADKNTEYVTLGGLMLANRLIWLSVGFVILGISCWRFSFATGISAVRRSLHSMIAEVRGVDPDIPVVGTCIRGILWLVCLPFALLSGYRHEIPDTAAVAAITTSLPAAARLTGPSAALRQLLSQVRVEFLTTVRSPVFVVVMLFAVIETFASLAMRSSQGFGLAALPVTYAEISTIRTSLYVYLVAVITFYAGVVIWKERDARLDEVYDALPHPTWISFGGKLIAIMLVVFSAVTVGMLCGIVHQAANGYTRFQLWLYVRELYVYDMVQLFCFVVLAMLVHVVSPNKYVGYFAFIILLVVNAFAWDALDVSTLMVRYGQIPDYTYSDMFGFAPFAMALQWFGSYWVLFGVFLCTIAILLWQRGRERGFFTRIRMAGRRWTSGLRTVSCASLVLWAVCAGWVYRNTHVLNSYRSDDAQTDLQVRYEREHKADQNLPQPRITDVRYDIDLYPERRGLVMAGQQTLVNPHAEPIKTVFLVVNENFETEAKIDGGTLTANDQELSYRTYTLDPPMQPAEQRQMTFTLKYEPRGFENSLSVQQIVQNGTFFNNTITPQIGYQPGIEITDRDERRSRGLGDPVIALPLDPENLEGRRNTYLSNNSDWVNVETFISTSADQIAIAPGSLQKAWTEGGRRHFHYKVDHPSLNFYSFISARYEVQRTDWNGVDVEVYYHPEHHWNVGKMIRSMKKSLQYYSENFGPYRHRQARIIEFPRISAFAQAFPGTMPYSEGIGFIADIEDVDDIDMVFYVVAHEMAHQWWAHQVIGANMRGATVLSETLAQYSALMVMEQEYGRDMMRKFLRYEMDSYLRARGSEQLDERPLLEVEPTQGYVHYRKGSIVMYCLRELIGEDRVNAALRSLVDGFGYADAPYPTSLDLMDALRRETPEKFHGMLADMFERITLFGNRTTAATWTKQPGGGYEVTIAVDCHKFRADAQGLESEVPLDDWIEIGAFARPPSGRKFGRTLHRELVHITQPNNTFTFTVDEEPHRAGVDPFSLLIDRVPDDNMKVAGPAEGSSGS